MWRLTNRLLAGIAVVLGAGIAEPALAAAETKPASVLTVSQCTDDRIAAYGVIRWPAVKGVDSYTLLFDDSALGGPQEVAVTEPFEQDNFNEAFPITTPSGTHQIIWTAAYGPCDGGAPDYSQRITNARVEYTRTGEFIEGTVRRRCATDACETEPVSGVRVTASGPRTASATTDAAGEYLIKVPKPGSYEVTPKKGALEFTPATKTVRVRARSIAKADFMVKRVLVKLSGKLTGRVCTNGRDLYASGCGETHLGSTFLQVVSYLSGPFIPLGPSIEAVGSDESFAAQLGNGRWSVKVPPGKYAIRVSYPNQPTGSAFSAPAERRVTVTDRAKNDLDFMVCAVYGLEVKSESRASRSHKFHFRAASSTP